MQVKAVSKPMLTKTKLILRQRSDMVVNLIAATKIILKRRCKNI